MAFHEHEREAKLRALIGRAEAAVERSRATIAHANERMTRIEDHLDTASNKRGSDHQR